MEVNFVDFAAVCFFVVVAIFPAIGAGIAVQQAEGVQIDAGVVASGFIAWCFTFSVDARLSVWASCSAGTAVFGIGQSINFAAIRCFVGVAIFPCAVARVASFSKVEQRFADLATVSGLIGVAI
jgi:hypothetical protein